jgi:hypothetical protein
MGTKEGFCPSVAIVLGSAAAVVVVAAAASGSFANAAGHGAIVTRTNATLARMISHRFMSTA